MMFASAFRPWHGCQFAEITFHVDTPTLRQLEQQYPLPDSLQRAVPKRQVEFLAGRTCAQRAIARLTGQPSPAIPQRSDRAPGWPTGIVGAITHTTGYAAALVASDDHYDGIGLDCEVVLTADKLALQKHICLPSEREDLQRSYHTWSQEMLLTLIFSAKESLFKCLYPQVQKYFGLHAARVLQLDLEANSFVIQLAQDLSPALHTGSCWTGYFARLEGLLMTAIASPCVVAT